MAIDLNALVESRAPIRSGRTETVTTIIPAGKTLKLETSPGGEDIASGTVPANKQWETSWVLSILETDI